MQNTPIAGPRGRAWRRTLAAVAACFVLSAAVGATAGDWPMWGGTPDRNMVSKETGFPAKFKVGDAKAIKWKAQLGAPTYGCPTVAGGRVFIGTNNESKLREGIEGDKGVVLCLDEKTGRLLWQATHDKLPSGDINDWKQQGIPSAPFVEGDRLYYVSNRCELVCADVEGFLDGENDGPYKDEKLNTKKDADIVWILDMFKDLKVFPHNLATCSPTGDGDLLFVTTSHGVDDSHKNVPHPEAPSLIAVNKKTGKVVWQRNDPGKNILHAQWSSPAYGEVGGRKLVIFGAGDGWCYAYNAKDGELVWKFDLNPKDAKWVTGGRGNRNSIIATPVLHNGKVYLASGQDPDYGDGEGHLYCIDATKTGDITESGKVWHVGGEDFRRTLSTVAVADNLLYVADLNGFFYCFDAATGNLHWKEDTFAGIWASPAVIDGKVFIGTQDGEILVFNHAPKMKLLATNDVKDGVFTGVVAANNTLFITTRQMLYAIPGTPSQAKPESTPKPTAAGSPGGAATKATAASPPAPPPNAASPPATPAPKAVALSPAAWPMFRGNPALTGIAPSDLSPPLQTLWQRDLKQPISASAAIVDDRVYLGSGDGTFFTLRLADGSTEWTYRTEWVDDTNDGEPKIVTSPAAEDIRPAINASALVDTTAIYFGDEQGLFHALDRKTGKPLWSFATEGEIISSANTFDDKLVFGSYDGNLYCLNRADGKLAWKTETEAPIHGTPGISDGRIVIAGCDAKIHVIKTADGTESTPVNAGARAAASPAIVNNTAVLGTLGECVLAIDLTNGKTRWTYKNPERHFPFHSSAAVTDSTAFVGGQDKMLHAIDLATGRVRWTFHAKGCIDSSPAVAGSHVFFGSADGNLYALNTDTGKLVWKYETGSPIKASPAIVSNRLVIGTEDGLLFCFAASGA